MTEKYAEAFRILSIILAYVITLAGIITLPFIFAIPGSWWIGLFLVITIIPAFPAVQTLLLGEKPASLMTFLKIYVAEYTSLIMLLLFLLVSAPIIAVAVAGVLPMMMLAVAVLMWPIVGLQQLGLEIGSKMPKQDIAILFWVTLGSLLLTGLYFILHKLAKKYGDSYFDLWAKGFRIVREFFRY